MSGNANTIKESQMNQSEIEKLCIRFGIRPDYLFSIPRQLIY